MYRGLGSCAALLLSALLACSPVRHDAAPAPVTAATAATTAAPHAPPATPPANGDVNPALAAAIADIPAIDNHAHPMRLVAEGEEDNDWDTLSYDGLEDFNLPPRLFPSNPEFIPAWKALWGYPYDDTSEEHGAWLVQARAAAHRAHGDAYSSWVLDQSGIQTMLANRVSLGRGLAAPRFRWVTYVEPLLVPLDTSALAERSPDVKAFIAGPVHRLRDDLSALGLQAVPPTLPEYVSKVVAPMLARAHDGGALAVKFESAYLRSLRFGDPPSAEAAAVYAKFAKRGAPSAAEYTTLQDYLFCEIARSAGQLGMAVHVHVAWGPGSYYRMEDTLSLALEPALNDPTLRKTNFVLIHGGWPDTAHAGLLMLKPNAWVDFSWQALVRYPRALAATLREWLELAPEKVLFGTDAFGAGKRAGWEERAWLGTQTARRALGIALTGMLADGEVTRERAVEIAHLVLHDNAARLYHL